MARKNLLEGLMQARLPAGNFDGSEARSTGSGSVASLTSQGAIGAVSRSVELLKLQAAEAVRLQEQLASGQAVVELDPDLVDASPVPDRLGVSAQAESDLLASVAEHGQQVAILVRPHPGVSGRFQAAYGHRRLKVARQLGQPVRAVIKALTDEQLVVAQGVENSVRADLSFIERALYAAALEAAGHKRDTIMAALGIDKTALSKLIAVPSRVSRELIEAIGPAPKTGRDRWLALAELLEKGSERAIAVCSTDQFKAAVSDKRFELVFSAVLRKQPKAKSSGASVIKDDKGARIGRLEETPRELVIALDRKALPGFDVFLKEALPALLEEFRRQQE